MRRANLARARTQVLSVLLALDPAAWIAAQKALLSAAVAAGATRFAPSDWGCGHAAYASVTLLAGQPGVWDACAEAAAGRPGFEWASFQCGLFMNYLGVG